MRILLVIAFAGCVSDDLVPCGEQSCPSHRVCAPDQTCVTLEQLAACDGVTDGTGCNVPGITDGVCRGSVCIPAGCGNGIVEPGEVCDDGNRSSLDGCRADCATLERCGDGVAEPALGEICDCGEADAVSSACSVENSAAPGASCRLDCTLARCGDGIVDPGEQCDDGNTAFGDGCRGDCFGRFYKMQTPTALTLRAVTFVDEQRAYAVGDSSILYYDGATWTTSATYANNAFDTVWASGPNDVWAGARFRLRHFDGTSWSTIDLPVADELVDITGTGPTDVYFLMSSHLFHYDGLVWRDQTPTVGCTNQFEAVHAFGGTLYLASESYVCRRDSGAWMVFGPASPLPNRDLVGDPSTGLWALASYAGSATSAVRPVDGTWMSVPGTLFGLAATSDELLGVGPFGNILQYRGGSWTHLVSPTELGLFGVAATGPTNVFVVGEAGTILH